MIAEQINTLLDTKNKGRRLDPEKCLALGFNGYVVTKETGYGTTAIIVRHKAKEIEVVLPLTDELREDLKSLEGVQLFNRSKDDFCDYPMVKLDTGRYRGIALINEGDCRVQVSKV